MESRSLSNSSSYGLHIFSGWMLDKKLPYIAACCINFSNDHINSDVNFFTYRNRLGVTDGLVLSIPEETRDSC
jgi:hypothetical protein